MQTARLLGCSGRMVSRSAIITRSSPWASIHCIPERLPRLECRRCRRRYRNGLAGPRVTPGTVRLARVAEGPEAREPNFFAIGKCLADGRGIHRPPPPWQRPCSGRSGPPDDQPSPSCSSILFPSGRRAIPRWPTAQFEQPATTNSALYATPVKALLPVPPLPIRRSVRTAAALVFPARAAGTGLVAANRTPECGRIAHGTRRHPCRSSRLAGTWSSHSDCARNSGIFPDASRSSSSSIQISRFSPRVDHVLTVGFSGKFRESKTPENTNAFRGLIWLRGLDLNQRPSGYEVDNLLWSGDPWKCPEYTIH